MPASPWLSSAGFHLGAQSAGRSLIHPFEKPEKQSWNTFTACVRLPLQMQTATCTTYAHSTHTQRAEWQTELQVHTLLHDRENVVKKKKIIKVIKKIKCIAVLCFLRYHPDKTDYWLKNVWRMKTCRLKVTIYSSGAHNWVGRGRCRRKKKKLHLNHSGLCHGPRILMTSRDPSLPGFPDRNKTNPCLYRLNKRRSVHKHTDVVYTHTHN